MLLPYWRWQPEINDNGDHLDHPSATHNSNKNSPYNARERSIVLGGKWSYLSAVAGNT
jgi:hypothetical protein